MVLITIVTGAYKPTYNWGGTTLQHHFGGSLDEVKVSKTDFSKVV